MSLERARALELIKRNIEKSGFHIYLVEGGSPTPRFAYTIGLRESLGAELVLAGALYYDKDEVLEIIRSVRKRLLKGKTRPGWKPDIDLDRLGSFRLRKSHRSWTRSLLLGALDFYGIEDIDAYQIVPDKTHHTIDIPDMAREWSPTTEPIWQWLHEPWSYSVPPESTSMTNLDALRGASITEACRWEEDYWEMFAGEGPAVTEADARLVPLGCLLASDPTLARVVELAIGTGVWRDGKGGDWNAWKRSESDAPA